MPVTNVSSINSVSAALPSSSANAVDLSLLKKANPNLDAVLASNPGVMKLLERNAARGAVAVPAAGDVDTHYTWPVWTHSPRSSPGSITAANEKDVIVVWQENPASAAKVSLGRYHEFPGQIIAVHQVDARGGSGTATDGGYIWPSIDVVASGKKDAAVTMRWAVVTLDAQGNAISGGFPGGWSGRTFTGVHGKGEYIPLKG